MYVILPLLISSSRQGAIQCLLGCTAVQVLITLAAAGVGLKYYLGEKNKKRLVGLREKWNAAGKDVVVLHMFPRAIFSPNASPFPVKLETWLRMNKIK